MENNQNNNEMIEVSTDIANSSPEPILSVLEGGMVDSGKLENTSDKVERDEHGRLKKGVQLNPAGRPKGTKNFNTLFEGALKKIAEVNGKTPDEFDMEIVAKGIEQARLGEYNFYRDLFDRRFGRAMQPMDHTTDGEKINTQTTWVIKEFKEEDNGTGNS